MKTALEKFQNRFKNAYILGSKPIQDWQRIIFVWVAIIFGVFVWSYFFYISIQSDFKSDFNTKTKSVTTKDKEAEIKDVVDMYKNREAKWFGVSNATNVVSGK